MVWVPLSLLALLSLGGASEAPARAASPATTDVDTLPFPTAHGTLDLSVSTVSGTSRGKPFVAHVAQVGDPRFMGFQLPAQGCGHKQKTSETAAALGCKLAINGGFFSIATGACVSNTVVNGTVYNVGGGLGSNFALTADSIVTGYVTDADLKTNALHAVSLLQGAGFLVRGGQPYANTSLAMGEVSQAFAVEMAPRTAVCAQANGTVLLVVVDGEEDIKAGADLFMMEDILLRLGCFTAVNLDGGGSSVMTVRDGSVYKWVSHPTCDDSPTPCEREVTSIACVSDTPL